MENKLTVEDFNEKYKPFLEKGHYGLDIYNQEVIDYLDEEFEKEIFTNPTFTYSQIKLKFGTSRVYANTSKSSEWESKVNLIVKK